MRSPPTSQNSCVPTRCRHPWPRNSTYASSSLGRVGCCPSLEGRSGKKSQTDFCFWERELCVTGEKVIALMTAGRRRRGSFGPGPEAVPRCVGSLERPGRASGGTTSARLRVQRLRLVHAAAGIRKLGYPLTRENEWPAAGARPRVGVVGVQKRLDERHWCTRRPGRRYRCSTCDRGVRRWVRNVGKLETHNAHHIVTASEYTSDAAVAPFSRSTSSEIVGSVRANSWTRGARKYRTRSSPANRNG
jgi:hypothetical protein